MFLNIQWSELRYHTMLFGSVHGLSFGILRNAIQVLIAPQE